MPMRRVFGYILRFDCVESDNFDITCAARAVGGASEAEKFVNPKSEAKIARTETF